MNYPIVQIKTKDGLWLHGLFVEALDSRAVFLNIPGTASNFYEEYFIEVMTEQFVKNGISMLSVNNRGSGVYDAYQKTGAAVEKFEDCVEDIDSWVAFALERGYKSVILSGHSLGTEKVVYYMQNGRHVEAIKGLVLLAPADSYGSHRMDQGKPNVEGKNRVDELLKISQGLIGQGKGDVFLDRRAYGSHGGIMPKSADSFVNFLGADSKVLEALPFATGRLENYGKIKIPVLAVIGDKREYTALSLEDSIALLKRENPNAEIHQIKDCDHDFQEKEDELTQLVVDFISKTIS